MKKELARFISSRDVKRKQTTTHLVGPDKVYCPCGESYFVQSKKEKAHEAHQQEASSLSPEENEEIITEGQPAVGSVIS